MIWTIRKARISDCAAVKLIEGEAGLSAWTEEAYSIEAIRTGSIFLVASDPDEDTIAGFTLMRLITTEIKDRDAAESFFEAEILNLGVRSELRRKGIARSLVSAVISELEALGRGTLHLEVRSRNEEAIAFYTHLGFEISGRRPGFYSSPVDDAVLMSKRI
ncbi:MAG: GNAT family N-acetyltransferase [Aridibacter famidurans]|nr:GNAT family N-acetyltransferase [Aridibacter famidurans]